MPLIPVTLITGFLGSGKTSLINALLRDAAFANTAVLINEFGEVAIDHDLVAKFSDELIVTSTGCLCCQASSDLKQSLFDLWNRRRKREIRTFDRVIVETTGLADPVPIVSALLSEPSSAYIDRIVAGQFALSRVLTLFDVVNGAASLDAHFEALKQVALADVILLTKTDLARDPATRQDIDVEKCRLRAVNPGMIVLDRSDDWCRTRDLILRAGTYDLRSKGEDALAWLRAEAVGAAEPHHHPPAETNRHGVDIQAHCIVIDSPVSIVAFYLFLNVLKMIAGENLLRLKGLVALAEDPECPLVVHGVQHLVHPIDKLEAWPSADKSTRIVLIGRNLPIEALRTILTTPASRRHAGALADADIG